MAETLAVVSAYAVVVAITTLPVLAVIAVLLESGKASRGWTLACGYAISLTCVFSAASFGLSQLPFPRVRIRGVTEVAAGVLLVGVAVSLWLWHHSRTSATRHKAPARRSRSAHPITRLRAGLLGAQFALHPENLALTFAAAAHVTGLGGLERIAMALCFAVVGVSTVALPTLMFAVAGDRTRARLETARDSIRAHGMLLAVVVLATVGAVLFGLGLWRVLSL